MAHARDGHRALLHRLEQGRLRLGGGAVDLVREEHVVEHGPRLEHEALVLGLLDEDGGAGDVGRHEVGGELHATEGEHGGVCEGTHQARLAEPRRPFDQHVPARQGCDEHVLDEGLLAEDHLGDGAAKETERFGESRYGRVGHALPPRRQ